MLNLHSGILIYFLGEDTAADIAPVLCASEAPNPPVLPPVPSLQPPGPPCVCVCTCTCTHALISVCMCVHMCEHVCVHSPLCMCVHACEHVCVCTHLGHVAVHVCMRVPLL